MTNTPFADAARPPQPTLDEDKKSVEKMYGAVRGSESEDRLAKTIELMNSAAFQNVAVVLPWFAVDIAYACAENIPKEMLVSGKFLEFFNQHPAVTSLSNLYPKAAEWYKDDVARIVESGEQHRNRFAWQHGWRTERKTFGDMPDDLKHNRLVALAECDLLKNMSLTVPWSVADVIISLADSHPNIGKHEFVQTYLLRGVAFEAIQRDSPVLAEYYEQRVAKFAPQTALKPEADPKVQPS